MAWLCACPCISYVATKAHRRVHHGARTSPAPGLLGPCCGMAPGTWASPWPRQLLHSLPPCPTRESQQSPPAMGTTGRRATGFISHGQKAASPPGPLSEASASYIMARGRPPYLLAPILYEVDSYCLIVDVFQGQSYERWQTEVR